MKTKITTLTCVVLAMTACATHHTARNDKQKKEEPAIAFMNPNDKKMSCKELQLEMNEAEFFSKTAHDDTEMGFSSIFSPVKTYKTVHTAQKTIENSQIRIEYLNQIYNILNCNGRTGIKGANVEVPQERTGAGAIAVSSDYPERTAPKQMAQQQPYALEEPTIMLPNEEDDDYYYQDDRI